MFLMGLLTVGCAAIAGACIYTSVNAGKQLGSIVKEKVEKHTHNAKRDKEYRDIVEKNNISYSSYSFDDVDEVLESGSNEKNIPYEDINIFKKEIDERKNREEERVNEWGETATPYILDNSFTFNHFNPLKCLYFCIKASFMDSDEIRLKLKDDSLNNGGDI